MQHPWTDALLAQLRVELSQREISQAELARRIGRSEMWVSRALRGSTPLPIPRFEELLSASGIDLEDLFQKAQETVA